MSTFTGGCIGSNAMPFSQPPRVLITNLIDLGELAEISCLTIALLPNIKAYLHAFSPIYQFITGFQLLRQITQERFVGVDLSMLAESARNPFTSWPTQTKTAAS